MAAVPVSLDSPCLAQRHWQDRLRPKNNTVLIFRQYESRLDSLLRSCKLGDLIEGCFRQNNRFCVYYVMRL